MTKSVEHENDCVGKTVKSSEFVDMVIDDWDLRCFKITFTDGTHIIITSTSDNDGDVTIFEGN